MKVGKCVITSQPELRCCIDEITELNMKTVMVVGGVKQRKVTLPSAHDFKIEDLNPYDIIGQHGANLLLEIQDSCFEKTGDEEDGRSLVFGAICVGTQVIFTALEMNKSHIHAIKQLEGEDLNKVVGDDNVVETSSISYTRPYNILKAADRSEMYEPLLRMIFCSANPPIVYGTLLYYAYQWIEKSAADFTTMLTVTMLKPVNLHFIDTQNLKSQSVEKLKSSL
ncbi:unnamed protein product [Mytilus edulis]|uniref:Uncharacterized protein n=1 Tax=Mytilus edulis TaxID=6550 RepID=A0A8S3SP92_MYTED|nr:unnamed protein product [Mytilus edulis]